MSPGSRKRAEKNKTEGNFNISSASVKKEKRLLAVLVIYTLMVWGREGVSETAAGRPQQIIGRFHYFSIMHIVFAAG